ncbi:AarF/ABC1/UbiB kinase family protein [Limnothrix sp. FACHB-708]|uniref:ABC1 kinase family protein n=1 Tax=Limnothrix sp. FACHB-406 TaxID=2692817 RepID=UPI001688DE3B|nr:AarF/ABC1/UbiB kinase family protein [Limnothrix sp. FACHB-708]MBD2589881.1 AarF/ABC1/UbiB kinase family protein [Limnothrix sp. FACHB-406]
MRAGTTSNRARRYDPKEIARFYGRRPWIGILRLLQIAWFSAAFVFGWLSDQLWGERSDQVGQRAEQLRQILIHLGPTFIKVGQALSTRPDLVRVDYLAELEKLQDQLPPFSTELAFSIIEADLDRPLRDIFREISPEPIAAASLGQVYRAKLYSGEDVAVKVQRPNLLPTLTLDLYLIRWCASWAAPWLPLNLGHDLTLIVDEFGSKLFEEIDYQNEGRNAERFGENFRDDPTVKVPVIYWDYSSHRVLTLEWIDGLKLTNTDSVREAGLDRDSLIGIGVTSGLRQLLEFGFFHADPHPGNLFALRDGRMAYIDFGMMDQLNESTKETIVDSVVHLLNRKYEELAGDFVRLGFLAPNTNIRPIIPALESVLGEAIGRNVGSFNFKTVTDRFSELMYDYPFRVPAKFALIIRSLVTQEGLALSLNPQFKILEIAYPYVARRLLMGESPQLRRRLIEVLFEDGKFQWTRLENMLAIARSDSGFDLVPTAGLGLRYLMSEEGQLLRQRLLLALVEDDRLHGAELQRLWDLVKDDLEPSRLMQVALDTAWDAIAEFSRDRAAQLLPTWGAPAAAFKS